MGEVKTKVNDLSVNDFINALDDETKKADSFKLLEMYTRITGEQPKMWGSSIIGFGSYHLKSERSSQEADWPLAAFSPRKQTLTLYVMPEQGDYSDLLGALGKHKTSKACLYINRLDDVDLPILERLIAQSFEDSKKLHNQN
jgi:hypothetical protein